MFCHDVGVNTKVHTSPRPDVTNVYVAQPSATQPLRATIAT
jgi:hypothetical protein